ncbi:MAG TPA: hypothetical protein ENN79_11150, partial [Desulfobacteraceae bacterium]|nr:hypothetical protein [Desulfobacteraceae bacterium]
FGMIYLFMNHTNELAELGAKEKAMTAELAAYTGTNKQLKQIKTRIGELEAKLEAIQVLEKAKAGPALLLGEVARSVPNERLWLRMIEEKDGILKIEGSAVDNDSVAYFMTELEKAAHILSVDLVHAKMRHIAQYRLNATDFGVLCKTYSFKNPEPQNAQKDGKPARARR